MTLHGQKVIIDIGNAKEIIFDDIGVYQFVKEQLKNKSLSCINNTNIACKMNYPEIPDT